MAAAERIELERAEIAPKAKAESYEGRHKKPRAMRLPPSDIADLRYVFCEMEAEAGVKSAHGRMAEAKAKEIAGRAKRSDEKRSKKSKRAPKQPSAETIAALRAIMGDDSIGEEHVGVETADRSIGAVAVVVKAPTLSIEDRLPPAIDEATREIVRTGDGRELVAYGGIEPRRFPPSVGRTVFLVKCKGDEGARDMSEPNDLEAWSDWSPTRSEARKRHTRGWRCREALLRMQETPGGALHAVVLRRVYGHRNETEPMYVTDREIAPLLVYTPTVRAMCAEAVREIASHRVTVAEAAAMVGAQQAANEVARLERALADLEPGEERRKAAIAAGDAAVERLKARLARAKGAARSKLRRKLHRKLKKRVELQKHRAASLERYMAAIPERRALLVAALAFAKRMAAAPVSKAVRETTARAIHAGATREVTPWAVLREALTLKIEPRDGESKKSAHEREALARSERARVLRAVAAEAEQLLVAASNAYRAARGAS